MTIASAITEPTAAESKSEASGIDRREAQAGERRDLLESLARHRHFLRFPVRDLSDEQAALHPTASALCLGGLIKHVALTEGAWVDFILGGADGMADSAEKGSAGDWGSHFQMQTGDTLAGLLENYERVAARTTEVVNSIADLDDSHPLPEAPWFAPGARWSARRVLLHLIAETAQHAGHADILRETIDGAKTMA
jgi:uncharacterized damage-inducible protein DinB